MEAIQVEERPKIDGVLDEPLWNLAITYSGFTQRDPFQGNAASYDTEIRIVYDESFLYIGAVCKDSLWKRSNVRVQNLVRDFDAFDNDRLSIAIDGFRDGQNASGFEVTPYGNQREVQVIDGDERNANESWNGLWHVRTTILNSAWIAEIAIPWKTLRYPQGADELWISFSRNIRRSREVNTYPDYPRVFSHYRMDYAASLKGIRLPKPGTNIQINPYILGNTTEQGPPRNATSENNLKIGGEFKWAINPNTILDGTINTDFAQVDVDQQVQNLTRFSVLFPEQRQFFLENASIFRTSVSDNIQPFFSRRIGLDGTGAPIPLDGGLRLTGRSDKSSLGVLAMRQRESDTSPLTHFLVGRYVRNFSKLNRFGAMVTHREESKLEQPNINLSGARNTTATFNTFLRPNKNLGLETMISTSFDSNQENGLAAHTWIGYDKNWANMRFTGQYVSENYNPKTGFLALDDYVLANPEVLFDLRPKWLPKFIRSYGPDIEFEVYWNASDGRFQQALGNIALIDTEFDKGGDFEFRIFSHWQQLDRSFEPLGITIAPGFYRFTRYEFRTITDYSRRIAGEAKVQIGNYFDGKLTTYSGRFRVSPVPHVDWNISYIFNRLRNLGVEGVNQDTHLLSTDLRLFLNPRVQLITNYQWNSAEKRNIWNVRFAWEYSPLSFVYLVFNQNEQDGFVNQIGDSKQSLITKVTLLKQF